MRMGQGVRTGLGHGGITCVLQTQFSSFFFINYTKYNKHRFRASVLSADCETFFFALFRIVL